MNKYRKFAIGFMIAELLCILIGNIYVRQFTGSSSDRKYMVDISRIVNRMKEGETLRDIDLSEYSYIVDVREFHPGENGKYAYIVEDVDGVLYKFEYCIEDSRSVLVVMNLILGIMLVVSAILLWYLGRKMIMPFERITSLPEELAKGNLAVPIPEEKSKFFGKYLWGMDMLREKLEDNRAKELELIKERKTLILSLSHDIKTPLSAIDLYVKALINDLYDSEEKKREALEGIDRNSAEIKKYVNEIANASRKDFMSLNVINEEVYLADIIEDIRIYYEDKMHQNHTEFRIQDVDNCLLSGDKDRIVEALQNVIENAIKYGDGKQVSIKFDEEENCKLITVSNTGCNLPEDELPHLFDSFYRGRNSKKVAGSGLGLYICKELLQKMDGDIFAQIDEDIFRITLVLRKM